MASPAGGSFSPSVSSITTTNCESSRSHWNHGSSSTSCRYCPVEVIRATSRSYAARSQSNKDLCNRNRPSRSPLRRTLRSTTRLSYRERSMSFLDNLENNLKSLESSEQGREGAEREQKARDSARAAAQAAAPYAEALKKGPYTAELL